MNRKRTLATGLLLLLLPLPLTACGESVEDKSRKDAEKAWSMKTPAERDATCQAYFILGPDRMAREMEAGDRDKGRDTSARDYQLIADIVGGKCLEENDVDLPKAPKVLKPVKTHESKQETKSRSVAPRSFGRR